MPDLTILYAIMNIIVSTIPIPMGRIAPNVYVIPRTKPSKYSGRNRETKKDIKIIPIIIQPGMSEPIVKKKDNSTPNISAPKNL